MFLFYSTEVGFDHFVLKEEEHQHCVKVLRHRIGDQVTATDGKGHWLVGTIRSIDKHSTIVDIISKEYRVKNLHAKAIAISPTKTPARIEWFVEKAVEIGIDEIILFVGKRTEKKSSSTVRLEKIALSAMKQSLRTHLPQIIGFDNLKDAIKYTAKYEHRFIAHLEPDTKPLRSLVDPNTSAIVLIGPEGDFTPDEIKYCLDDGLIAVTLGDHRLRTETAGLVALFEITLLR
jgi:16S rRNA (uracil1498-N3)-methyltransferase